MRSGFLGSAVLTSIAVFAILLMCKGNNASYVLALDTTSNDSLRDLIRQEIRNLVAPNIPQVYTGEIPDPPFDWINPNGSNATGTGDPSTDIVSVTYTATPKYFNSTLWLLLIGPLLCY